MGYCSSSILNDSVKEKVDRFFKDVDSKYGENYLWMKMFFELMEKRTEYYKRQWEEFLYEGDRKD